MRNIFIAIIFIVSAVAITGCGQMNSAKGDVHERAFPMKADNPNVREFNEQLGEIKDVESAERTVNSFVGYVDSRLLRSGSSIQSFTSLIKPEAVKEMAKREAAARNAGGMSIASETEVGSDPLLDIGTVTDSINELGSSEGISIDDDTVATAKAVVEESMPNINSGNSAGMTPLEAAVIGYALVSGDDGTATEESVDLPVDKMNSFVEKITN